MKKLTVAFAALLLASFPAFADPSGTYAVTGVDPDGAAYEAQLEIAKVGDVYALTYTLSDGTEQEGSAIGDDSFLAYGYGDDEETGVGLMTGNGGSWEGVWTNLGASKMGTETWTRK